MSGHDAVGATGEAVARLEAMVARVADEYGDTLGVRRLRSDVQRFKDDLAELGQPMPGHRPGGSPTEVLIIDDKPYDDSMWEGSESEAQRAV